MGQSAPDPKDPQQEPAEQPDTQVNPQEEQNPQSPETLTEGGDAAEAQPS